MTSIQIPVPAVSPPPVMVTPPPATVTPPAVTPPAVTVTVPDGGPFDAAYKSAGWTPPTPPPAPAPSGSIAAQFCLYPGASSTAFTAKLAALKHPNVTAMPVGVHCSAPNGGSSIDAALNSWSGNLWAAWVGTWGSVPGDYSTFNPVPWLHFDIPLALANGSTMLATLKDFAGQTANSSGIDGHITGGVGSYVEPWAAKAGKVICRLGWEAAFLGTYPDGTDWYSWSGKATQTDFVAAFNHQAAIVKSIVPTVLIEANFTAAQWAQPGFDPLALGLKFDIAGIDIYSQASQNNTGWGGANATGAAACAGYARLHGLKLAVSECSSDTDDTAFWTGLVAFLKANADILAVWDGFFVDQTDGAWDITDGKKPNSLALVQAALAS